MFVPWGTHVFLLLYICEQMLRDLGCIHVFVVFLVVDDISEAL